MAAATSTAQTVVDAVRYGNSEISGTARYRSMAGAFGALGGDPSCISDNPSGLAIYRGTSSFSFTPHMAFTGTESKGYNKLTGSDNAVGLSNFAWIGSFKNTSSDYLVNFNFGITMERRQENQSKYDVALNGMPGSMSTYLTNQANNYLKGTIPADVAFDWDNSYTKAPFLSMLAYSTYAIDENPNNKNAVIDPVRQYCQENGINFRPAQGLLVKERTRLDNYNFAMAANFDDRFYVGATLSIMDFNSIIESTFDEYYDGLDDILAYDNRFETKGSGVGLNLGVMWTPIDSWRIGAAVHTPTWTTMREIYDGSMCTDPDYSDNSWESFNDEWKFDLATPWEYQFSTAFIVGNRGLISLEYDLRDFASMKYSANQAWGLHDSDFRESNDAIKTSLTKQHTLKVGGEYRITNSISARAGYAYSTSPYTESALNATIHASQHNINYYSTTKPNFQTLGAQYYASCGAGWRGRCWSIDLAYVFHNLQQKAAAYPGDFSECNMVDIDFAQQNWDLTIAYRF